MAGREWVLNLLKVGLGNLWPGDRVEMWSSLSTLVFSLEGGVYSAWPRPLLFTSGAWSYPA